MVKYYKLDEATGNIVDEDGLLFIEKEELTENPKRVVNLINYAVEQATHS